MRGFGATELLRAGLLEEVAVVLAGADGSVENGAQATAPAIAASCRGLGARVIEWPLNLDDMPSLEARVEGAVAELLERELTDELGVLLALDGAGLFASAAAAVDSRYALRACLQASWIVTRALTVGALLANGRGGRIVYVAPAACAGEHADAARAGLENLARTLSIEWARHSITTVAIAPPAELDDRAVGEVAALTAYLASPAGAYFSGCQLDLRGPWSPTANAV